MLPFLIDVKNIVNIFFDFFDFFLNRLSPRLNPDGFTLFPPEQVP
jgi:hypothetical protein